METANNIDVPLLIRQTEADNILWPQLVAELSRHYEGTLKVVLPTELNERTYSWFRTIEEYNFRSELRYSFDEMKPVLAKPDLLFLFVFKDELPEIVVLGYTNPSEAERVFRLDTFAINKRGKGIGHIVINFLIKWARAKQYTAIELDTEETDEKGIRLQRFYEKHKFVVVARDAKGDITMRCPLAEASSVVPTSPSPAATLPPGTSPTNAPPVSSPPTTAPPADTPPAADTPAGTPESTESRLPTIPAPDSPPPATALVAAAALHPTPAPSQTGTSTTSVTEVTSPETKTSKTATPAETRSDETSDNSAS